MQRLKQGDEVIVVAGKDKGKRGVIAGFSEHKGSKKVFVDGVNLVKKHVRPNPQSGETGGIIEKEAALDLSNVMLFNPETEKGDRVGFRFEGDAKVRYFKSNSKTID